MKIDKIWDVMWWTLESKQSFNILCFGKYLSKSFETSKSELKDIMQKIFEKIGCHSVMCNLTKPLYFRLKQNHWKVFEYFSLDIQLTLRVRGGGGGEGELGWTPSEAFKV